VWENKLFGAVGENSSREKQMWGSGGKQRFSPQKYRAGLAGFSDWKSKKTPAQIWQAAGQ
jgi:hypothetical protein